jgi:hypothetical protein
VVTNSVTRKPSVSNQVTPKHLNRVGLEEKKEQDWNRTITDLMPVIDKKKEKKYDYKQFEIPEYQIEPLVSKERSRK